MYGPWQIGQVPRKFIVLGYLLHLIQNLWAQESLDSIKALGWKHFSQYCILGSVLLNDCSQEIGYVGRGSTTKDHRSIFVIAETAFPLNLVVVYTVKTFRAIFMMAFQVPDEVPDVRLRANVTVLNFHIRHVSSL